RGQREPVHPDCGRALLAVCVMRIADHASMISMAFWAYASLPVRYQSSASVYAASVSACSSLQPTSGFIELGPQSTDANGVGVYVSEASGLALTALSAVVHGSTLAVILPFTNSSDARVTSTPGCRKTVIVSPPSMKPPLLPPSSAGGAGAFEWV